MTASLVLPSVPGVIVWGWRSYGRAHAYRHVNETRVLLSLCNDMVQPTTTGAPSRKRCKRCLKAIALEEAAGLIRVLAEQRTVYRSEVGRRGRLTKRVAYLDAAWHAWRQRYPCVCDGETGFVCGEHMGREKVGDTHDGHYADDAPDDRAEYRRKVIKRLARWLTWRDKRLEAA